MLLELSSRNPISIFVKLQSKVTHFISIHKVSRVAVINTNDIFHITTTRLLVKSKKKKKLYDSLKRGRPDEPPSSKLLQVCSTNCLDTASCIVDWDVDGALTAWQSSWRTPITLQIQG